MTTSEIAAEHGVTRQTVHTHRTNGIFPKPVEGSGSTRPRFRADEVAEFFAAHPPSPGKRTDLAPPQRPHAQEGGPVTKKLPQPIADALQRRQRNVELQDYGRVRQSTSFVYRDGDDELDLAMFEGPVPVPAKGETITLWNDMQAPLVVVDVVRHYGLGHSPEDADSRAQHVSVVVYVDVPK